MVMAMVIARGGDDALSSKSAAQSLAGKKSGFFFPVPIMAMLPMVVSRGKREA